METGNKLLVILLVGVALGEVHGSTNSTTVEDEAYRCYQTYWKLKPCPDYDVLESCFSRIKTTTSEDKIAIRAHLNIVKREKDYCPELKKASTCAPRELEKCFVTYKVYEPSYDPRLCSEIKNVEACVEKVNQACGGSYNNERLIAMVVDFDILKEKKRECFNHRYLWCKPATVKICTKPWYDDNQCCACSQFGSTGNCLWAVTAYCSTPEMTRLANYQIDFMTKKCREKK